jgi:protein-disulfide isomerase
METGQKQWYTKWWGISLMIFLTLFLIVLTALIFYIADIASRIKKGQWQSDEILTDLKQHQTSKIDPTITGVNNYWLGSAKPKVTIVEFADFSCPLCQNSFFNIREISLKYKNNVKIIFRDFPIYENSVNLALAGRCAGEQGLFWLMHDKLYARQGKFELSQLPDFAYQIGADVTKFNNCLAGEKYLNNIKKDYADGQSLEIRGTPTWFINGYKIEGDIPHDLFIQIVEELIK